MKVMTNDATAKPNISRLSLHFFDMARIFFGSLVIKLIFEFCATLTHLWGGLGGLKINMYKLGE